MVDNTSLSDSEAQVLLAEDNPVNQDVIFEMLSSLGCCVKVVDNGKEALEAAGNQRFDLILMDCQMPVMDGHDSTREIRLIEKQKGCAHVPIIGITGRSVKGNYEKCKVAGMDDCLDKPFTIEQLQNIIFRWTGSSFESSAKCKDKDQLTINSPGSDSFFQQVNDCLEPSILENIFALGDDSMVILKKIANIYFRNAPIQFTLIRKGIKEKNPETIFQASHSLKSASANVGAMNLVAMSQELESNARSRMIEGAELQLGKMESEYLKVVAALESIIKMSQNQDSLFSGNPESGDRDDSRQK